MRTVHHPAALVLATAIGCAPPPVQTPSAPAPQLTFAVLPAESDAYPLAARVTTERLRRARVRGLPEPMQSKVSLEVAQLSIECVEQTPGCYAAVGRELAVNQLLFAEILPGDSPQQLQIKVTLFDVDSKQSKRSVIKSFSSEEDVWYSIGDVVAEATKP